MHPGRSGPRDVALLVVGLSGGIVLSAAIFAALYFALLWLLYRPWDERETREAVAAVLPRDPMRPIAIAVRALAVVAVFAAAVPAIAT